MNPTPRSRYRLLLRASLAALPVSLIFPLAQTARAADGTWTSTSSSTWSTTSRWSGSTVADGSGFTASFTSDVSTSDLTVNLNTARTIGNLIFSDSTTSTAGNWILANNSDALNILTLAGTTTPTITVNSLGTGKVARISLELAGTQGLTKAGTGTLELTGVNTYTGTTTVNAGTLTLGSGGSLNSASTLAVGGSGIFNFSGAAAATQTVTGLNVTTGFGTVNNTVAGTTLTLGAIVRSGGGMVDFGTTTGNINTSTANTNGIIGAWAFTGTGTTLDYAVSNGAGNAISSLGAATSLPAAGPGDATTHYTLAGAQTQTANTVGNTLRYTGGAATLGLGTTSLGLSGLMNAGTGLLTITGTAGNAGLVTTGELAIASNTQGITISSVISGTGSVVYGGPSAGTLTLSGVNTYSGGTTINSGVLRATNGSALGSGAATVASGARLSLSGGVTFANTVNLNGTQALENFSGTNTLSGTVNLQSNSTVTLTGTSLNINGPLNLGTNQFTASSTGTTTLTLGGAISGSGTLNLNNIGGTVVITNDNSGTYSGQVNVNRTTLAIGNDKALGTGTLNFGTNDQASGIRSTDTTLRTIGNAFVITGNSASTYTFGSGTAGLNGDLTFTNTTAIAIGQNSKTLQVLNRTEFDAGFTGGAVGITKTGAGTLVMAGANTYTGTTTVSAGTLALGANNVFAVSNFSLGGGTLGVGTFTNTAVGTLALTGNSTITLGSGGAFAFADSDALNWGSNTLSITGTFLDGFSIRFGTDATGLTGTQLALISINGGAASINSSGYLVASAIPEPATYAALAGLGVLGLVAARRRRSGV